MSSQNLYDFWSLVHFGSGVISSKLLQMPLHYGVTTHQLFEYLENSPIMITAAEWITETAPDLSHKLEWDIYHGDSKWNTTSDTVFFLWGAVAGEKCCV